MSIKQTLSKVRKSEKKVNFSTKIKSSIKKELGMICKNEGVTQAELLEAFVIMYKQENANVSDCLQKDC